MSIQYIMQTKKKYWLFQWINEIECTKVFFLFIDWLIPFDELKSLNWEARISTKWNTWTNTA